VTPEPRSDSDRSGAGPLAACGRDPAACPKRPRGNLEPAAV